MPFCLVLSCVCLRGSAGRSQEEVRISGSVVRMLVFFTSFLPPAKAIGCVWPPLPFWGCRSQAPSIGSFAHVLPGSQGILDAGPTTESSPTLRLQSGFSSTDLPPARARIVYVVCGDQRYFGVTWSLLPPSPRALIYASVYFWAPVGSGSGSSQAYSAEPDSPTGRY